MAETNIQRANEAWKNGAENYSRIVCDELSSFRGAGWQKLITEQTGGKQEMRVLDIGCGPGFFTILPTVLFFLAFFITVPFLPAIDIVKVKQ